MLSTCLNIHYRRMGTNFQLKRSPAIFRIFTIRAASNIIFLISAQNIDCGYSLEPPLKFLSEHFQFLVVEIVSIFE